MKLFFGFFAAVFGFFVVLATLHVLSILYMNSSICVVLPNGYMIRHVSIINFDRDERFQRVLTDRDGNKIARTESFLDFNRHPTKPNIVVMEYGDLHLEMDGTEMMPVILGYKDRSFGIPEAEHGKWSEPDPEFPHSENISMIGISLVYDRLWKNPGSQSELCGTPWFDPED